jgi:hypothetical protein
MTSRLLILVAALTALCACGTPGAPRPPSLRLPEAVRDLAATRQGSTVTLTWTEPARTTDGENIRSLGATLVCMGVNDFPMTHCDEMVADLSQTQFAQCAPQVGKPVTCAVTLPLDVQRENPKGQATYAVEVLNRNGRSAGLSNQVRLPTAPTAGPAEDVVGTVHADQIAIGFSGYGYNQFSYHVFRAEAGSANFVDLGPAHRPGEEQGFFFQNAVVTYVFDDRSFEWEKTYVYRVVAMTAVSLPDGAVVDVKGDPSPEVSVFAHDVFSPVAPQGVQAVASGVGQQPFVDMTWAPNTESDLAGYNVYRHEQGQSAEKINIKLVKTPSYRDAGVQRGKTYLYSVSAIDLRNNESSKSQEASETVH